MLGLLSKRSHAMAYRVGRLWGIQSVPGAADPALRIRPKGARARIFGLPDPVSAVHKQSFRYEALALTFQELNALLCDLSDEGNSKKKSDPSVLHALRVREAIAHSNYTSLFRLFLSVPNMGGYLMDQFVPKERRLALVATCRAYRPSIGIPHLASLLGFLEIPELLRFLHSVGIELQQDKDARALTLDCKAALEMLSETA